MTNNQLSFDNCALHNDLRASYMGFDIVARHDPYSDCPWLAWEGNAPLIVYHDRRVTDYTKGTSFDLLNPFASGGAFTDQLVRRHMKAICAIFDVYDVHGAFIGDRRATFADWLKDEARDAKGYQTERKRELLSEALDGLSVTDKLETLAKLYELLGWPVLSTCTSGYSQGDYADLLFVVPPDFIARYGAPKMSDKDYWKRDLKGARDLYGAWAWGDVYSCYVEKDGETLESCGGFYGTDFDTSGLAEFARVSVAGIIQTDKETRAEKVKEMIRARVPLHYRPALIPPAYWEGL